MINTIISNGLAFALPLFIMAVGGMYSEKSGVMMLCVEGFQGFGAFCGAFAVLIAQRSLGGSSPWLIYIAIDLCHVRRRIVLHYSRGTLYLSSVRSVYQWCGRQYSGRSDFYFCNQCH